MLALIASCFYMFQMIFILTSENNRTSLGILFCAFIVLLVCDKELLNAKKYSLVLLFIAGVIFSHYSTAYVFLFIISLAYGMDLIFRRIEKQREHNFVNLPLLIYFMSLIFFWYHEITREPFRSAVTSFNIVPGNNEGVPVPKCIISPFFSLKIGNYNRLVMYALIGIGVLIAFVYT